MNTIKFKKTLLKTAISGLLCGLCLMSTPVSAFSVSTPDESVTFTPSEHAGKTIVVWVVADAKAAGAASALKETLAKGSTLAGVEYLFVVEGDAAAASALAASVPGSESQVFADPEGVVAQEYNLETGKSAIVVLDASGAEIYRHEGRDGGDVLSFASVASQVERRTRAKALDEYNLEKGVALHGYDPVTYFTENAPKKGSAQLASSYQGVTYYFTSEASRQTFAMAPEKYAPTYGGWCATAMAEGEKVEIDPENFKITDGRLFLFYKGLWGNAVEPWNEDEANLEQKADVSWHQISGE